MQALVIAAFALSSSTIHPLASVQLRTTYAVDWQVRVNGFDLGPLPSMAGQANKDGEPIRGFTSSGGLLEYSVVHPYFLKSGDNTVSVKAWRKPNYDDDKAAKTFALRVVNIDWDPKSEDQYSTEWPTRELGKIEVPPMALADKAPKEAKTTVKWAAPSLPSWSWIKGVKIANDAKTKESLYAAAQKAWRQLAAQASAPAAERAAFRDALKASTQEYAKACEIDGPKVHFVDDLAVIAATNDFPGAPTREQRKKAALAASKKPVAPVVADDAPSPVDPAVYDKPHLVLTPLRPIGEYTMDVFADGALAKLKAESDDGVISYYSNYPDGSWGAVGERLVEADLWFRKNAKGEWEIDAVVDSHMARLGMRDDPLKDLLEVQYPK